MEEVAGAWEWYVEQSGRKGRGLITVPREPLSATGDWNKEDRKQWKSLISGTMPLPHVLGENLGLGRD